MRCFFAGRIFLYFLIILYQLGAIYSVIKSQKGTTPKRALSRNNHYSNVSDVVQLPDDGKGVFIGTVSCNFIFHKNVFFVDESFHLYNRVALG